MLFLKYNNGHYRSGWLPKTSLDDYLVEFHHSSLLLKRRVLLDLEYEHYDTETIEFDTSVLMPVCHISLKLHQYQNLFLLDINREILRCVEVGMS